MENIKSKIIYCMVIIIILLSPILFYYYFGLNVSTILGLISIVLSIGAIFVSLSAGLPSLAKLMHSNFNPDIKITRRSEKTVYIKSESEKEIIISRIEVYSDRPVLNGKGIIDAGEKVGEMYKWQQILDGKPGKSYYKPREIRLRQSGTTELLPLSNDLLEKNDQEVNIEVKIYPSIEMIEFDWPRYFGELRLEPVSKKIKI